MEPKPYSLIQRDDGIYVAFMLNNQHPMIEIHFDHLAEAFRNHPADTPMYLLVDMSSGDKLPSIRYLVNRLRDFHKTAHSGPEVMYIAYIYRRDNTVFGAFIQLLEAMRINAPRRFFRTEEAATAWLLSQQKEYSGSGQSADWND